MTPVSAEPPLIGVTSSELRRKKQVRLRRHGEPAQTEMALGLTYLQAIVSAGGLPVIITPVPQAELEALLARLDGLVLSGGPDLDPRTYGQAAHEQLGPTESHIDEFELSLCTAAVHANTPVLGICRGLQALNVAAGGTLHQHVPEVLPSEILHRHGQPGHIATHAVTIMPGSRLAALIGEQPLQVNSFHHQAIDRVAHDLRVVAHAADGLIEAIEGSGPGWLFGVQWHAEALTEQPRHLALFEGLVSAARWGNDASSLNQALAGPGTAAALERMAS